MDHGGKDKTAGRVSSCETGCSKVFLKIWSVVTSSSALVAFDSSCVVRRAVNRGRVVRGAVR